MVEVPLWAPYVVDHHFEDPRTDKAGGARDDLQPDHQGERRRAPVGTV